MGGNGGAATYLHTILPSAAVPTAAPTALPISTNTTTTVPAEALLLLIIGGGGGAGVQGNGGSGGGLTAGNGFATTSVLAAGKCKSTIDKPHLFTFSTLYPSLQPTLSTCPLNLSPPLSLIGLGGNQLIGGSPGGVSPTNGGEGDLGVGGCGVAGNDMTHPIYAV